MTSCKFSHETSEHIREVPKYSGGTEQDIHLLKPSSGIRSILEDQKGHMWFASTEYVSKYDGEKIIYFSEEDGLGCVGRIHEENDGTIWVACGFSAYRYDGIRFIEHALQPTPDGSNWDVQEDDLWFQRGVKQFGNTQGPPGIYRLRDGEIDFLSFPVPPSDNDDSRYYPTTGAIQSIDGTTWFATMEMVIGYKDGTFTLIDRERMGRQDDPNQMGIRGLFADSQGRLWMADNGSGYFVNDGHSVEHFTKKYLLGKDHQDGNTLHRAFCAAEDKKGNMWFGTVYSGIWRFNPKTEEFTNYTETDGVLSESFWTIYTKKNGDLLFAGEKPGAVYQFNGHSFDRVF